MRKGGDIILFQFYRQTKVYNQITSFAQVERQYSDYQWELER